MIQTSNIDMHTHLNDLNNQWIKQMFQKIITSW